MGDQKEEERKMKMLQLWVLFLLAMHCIPFGGCKKSEKVGEDLEKPVAITQTAFADTTGGQPHEMTPQGDVTELEQDKAEIESRLEALISLIEEKETSLLAREQELLKRERRITAESVSLSERERSLRRLQIVSWVVLVVGLAGVIVGFVISGRTRKKALEEAGNIEKETKTARKKPGRA